MSTEKKATEALQELVDRGHLGVAVQLDALMRRARADAFDEAARAIQQRVDSISQVFDEEAYWEAGACFAAIRALAAKERGA